METVLSFHFRTSRPLLVGRGPGTSRPQSGQCCWFPSLYAHTNWNISPARVSSLILKAISVKQKPLYENLPLNTDVAKSVSVSSSVREGEPGVPLVRPRLRSSLPPEAATWSSAILLQKNRRAPLRSIHWRRCSQLSWTG